MAHKHAKRGLGHSHSYWTLAPGVEIGMMVMVMEKSIELDLSWNLRLKSARHQSMEGLT
jgi:hypothetical protein